MTIRYCTLVDEWIRCSKKKPWKVQVVQVEWKIWMHAVLARLHMYLRDIKNHNGLGPTVLKEGPLFWMEHEFASFSLFKINDFGQKKDTFEYRLLRRYLPLAIFKLYMIIFFRTNWLHPSQDSPKMFINIWRQFCPVCFPAEVQGRLFNNTLRSVPSSTNRSHSLYCYFIFYLEPSATERERHKWIKRIVGIYSTSRYIIASPYQKRSFIPLYDDKEFLCKQWQGYLKMNILLSFWKFLSFFIVSFPIVPICFYIFRCARKLHWPPLMNNSLSNQMSFAVYSRVSKKFLIHVRVKILEEKYPCVCACV